MHLCACCARSPLNHNEHRLKDAIISERVRWDEYRVPAPLTHSPEPANRSSDLTPLAKILSKLAPPQRVYI